MDKNRKIVFGAILAILAGVLLMYFYNNYYEDKSEEVLIIETPIQVQEDGETKNVDFRLMMDKE